MSVFLIIPFAVIGIVLAGGSMGALALLLQDFISLDNRAKVEHSGTQLGYRCLFYTILIASMCLVAVVA